MDYNVLTIAFLSFMLIVSIVLNFILMRKIEKMQDADIIDDITGEDEDKDMKIILYR